MLDPPDSWLTVSIDQNTGDNLFGSHLLPYPTQVWYHKGGNVLRIRLSKISLATFRRAVSFLEFSLLADCIVD